MVTPSFSGMTEEYSIQDIVPGGDNVWGYGGEGLEIVDSEGNSTETFIWWANGMGAEGDGWYDMENNLSKRTIPAGTGFLMNIPGGDFTVAIPGVDDVVSTDE